MFEVIKKQLKGQKTKYKPS